MMERKEKSRIDFKQVREVLEVVRGLKDYGIRPHKYSLVSPWERRRLQRG